MIRKSTIVGALAGVIVMVAAGAGQLQAQSYFQGFNGTVLPTDWTPVNRSTTSASGNPWTDGPGIVDSTGLVVVAPIEGDGYAITNYTATGSTSATATISNFLISPEFTTIKNGDVFSFYTSTTPGSQFPDRLQLLLSKSGASINVGTTTTSVGDFSTTLLTVNPNLTIGGYPESFALQTVTISGLTAPVDGRVALRYFVTNGGTNGANSNIIGVDSFSYTPVPEPSTWMMLFAGLGLFAGVQKWSRRLSGVVKQ